MFTHHNGYTGERDMIFIVGIHLIITSMDCLHPVVGEKRHLASS